MISLTGCASDVGTQGESLYLLTASRQPLTFFGPLSITTRLAFYSANEPCDLAHHLSGWIVAIGQIVAGGNQNRNVAFDQREDTKLLGNQFAHERRPSHIFG